MNILDDSLIGDIISAGEVTQAVRERLLAYYDIAIQAGADIIFNTCSSIGDVADEAKKPSSVPKLSIDEPMARFAVGHFHSIAVLATLPTTIDPTIRLIERCASEGGFSVEIEAALAEGAFKAFTEGDADRHDALILEAAKNISKGCEVIILAQASMARMESRLGQETGMKVLSSPPFGIASLKEVIQHG